MPKAEASTDLAALARFIQLPEPPERVEWATFEPAPSGPGLGPSDWSLAGILYFAPEAFERVAAKLETRAAAQPPEILPVAASSWLSARLPAAVAIGPDGDVGTWKGEAFAPDAFARAPLLQGFAGTLAEQQVVVLLLHTH